MYICYVGWVGGVARAAMSSRGARAALQAVPLEAMRKRRDEQRREGAAQASGGAVVPLHMMAARASTKRSATGASATEKPRVDSGVFDKNEEVLYTDTNSKVITVTVVAVHRDDSEPYYTVSRPRALAPSPPARPHRKVGALPRRTGTRDTC